MNRRADSADPDFAFDWYIGEQLCALPSEEWDRVVAEDRARIESNLRQQAEILKRRGVA